METTLYLQLSALMFLEYAVWGAWMPVLAPRLLGPLKMTGKQTGWIYATLPLASMISPLIAGQLADKYVDTRWVLAVCHGLGVLLLFVAARTDQIPSALLRHAGSTPCMRGHDSAGELAHVQSSHGCGAQSPIFIWAAAWALVGYMLTGWRNLHKGESDGSDCLKFAAILSAIMAVVCVIQPATPPKGSEGVPMFQALSMLSDPTFAVFIVASLIVAGMQQFYFLGTGQFLQDQGVSGKNVPGIMGIAQAAQALATLFLLGLFFNQLGAKWTLTLGAASWMLLFGLYTFKAPKPLIIGGQIVHGLAYVFFMIAGQMYVNAVAPPEIVGSAQALIILVTAGLAMFFGTQAAGFVMDKSSVAGKFNWSKVFMVPLLATLAGALALLLAFRP